MPGPAPKTRNWTARENVHKPSGLHLIVTGAVQVTNTNQQPQLDESAERNPKNLGLSLTIGNTGEPGLDVVCWKQAHFHKEVSANQYDNVTIRWDVAAIAQVPVVDDKEDAKASAARMAAMNTAAAAATKKPAKRTAAKKAAAKKSAPKKTPPKKVSNKAKKSKKKAVTKTAAARVVRAVGGWAKGAKKALKRAMGAKKAPKKTTKKSKAKKKR